MNDTADREQLLNWALDDFVVGHFLGIQITNYVDLEESLVIGSYSQDHLGHAGVLLELAGIDRGDVDYHFYYLPSESWTVTPLAAWQSEEWSDVVTKHLLYSALVAVRLRGLSSGPFADASQVLALENDQHRRHWTDWWSTLQADPEQRARLEGSLDDALARCGHLAGFGLPDAYGGAWEEELAPLVGDRIRGRPAGTFYEDKALPEAIEEVQSVVRADGESRVWTVWKQT